MGEMTEIADIVTTVLSEVRPTVTDGKASQAKYDLDETVADRARARIADLLAGFPAVPQIELAAIA